MNPARSNRPISTLLTSLPMDFVPAVRQVAALGFTHVDLVALAERPAEHLDVLAETGLLVSCASVGRGLPNHQTLDAANLEDRRAALAIVERHIADSARLGATHCYLVPGQDASCAALARFVDACVLLADFASQRQLRLCIEHCPGKALPSVAATLSWLTETAHENLSLLLDVGHCLISVEDPATAIRCAGPRLGYVHLDDNDGAGDLHWPLLAGRLTEEKLSAALAALSAISYEGALTLELSAQNGDPIAALRQGKLLVEQYLREQQEKDRNGC
jgi:sugar phosphate isomerase/epimerase